MSEIIESSSFDRDLARRASALAFLNIFFHGALCGMLSVIVKDCAEALHIENADVVFTFSIFSLASTAMIQVSSSWLLPRLRVWKVLLGGSLMFGVSCQLFFAAHDKASLSWAFLFLGLGLGTAFATANYLLVSHYEGRERSSKLALMTFFYCVGAVITPAVGGKMMGMGYSWLYAFLWPLSIFWVGTVLSYFVPSKRVEQKKVETQFGSWPVQVYLAATALFLFSLTEISFTNWLNVDGEEVMGLSTEHAAYLASVFWFVVGVGRYAASRLLLRVPARLFVVASCLLAMLGFYLYIQESNQASYSGAILVVLILGLGLSAVAPTLVSLGTSYCKSPGVLGFILSVGSLGPVVAPLTSQWVYSELGSAGNVASCIGYLVLVILLTLFLSSTNSEKSQIVENSQLS